MHMRNRLRVMVVSLIFVLAMPVFAASSEPANASSLMLVPSDAVGGFEQDMPSWALTNTAERIEFTDALLTEGHSAIELPDGAMFLEAMATVSLQPTRSEAKVPEPATLIFVGTSLIGIARVARRKQRQWTFRGLAAQIRATVAQEA